jgi:hypothetical protein
LFDQIDFSFASPFLDRLFAGDRGQGIFMAIKPDKQVYAIAAGKAGDGVRLVLVNAAQEIAGHPA